MIEILSIKIKMFSKTLYFCVSHLMYFLKSSINQNSKKLTIFGHSRNNYHIFKLI